MKYEKEEEIKMREKIQKMGKGLEIPQELEPVRMREKLEGQKKKRVFPIYKAASLAAVFAVIIIGTVSVDIFKKQKPLIPATVYSEKGIKGENSKHQPQINADEVKEVDLGTPASYEEVYEKLRKIYEKQQEELKNFAMTEDYKMNSMQSMSAGMKESADIAETTREASATNVQVEGIDEGYVVKNDGNYIYIVQEKSLQIIRTDNGSMTRVSEITLSEQSEEDFGNIQEVYLKEDKLIIIQTMSLSYSGGDCAIISDEVNDTVNIMTYDIKDRENPKLEGKIQQDGYFRTSRMSGDYLYVISSYSNNTYPVLEDGKVKEEEIKNAVPRVNGEKISHRCMVIPEYADTASFMVISSVNVKQPGKAADSEAILSNGEIFYVSDKNIYITQRIWSDSNNNETEILKFAYRDGDIIPAAKGKVQGILDGSFSMDEYNGNLRVVTTVTKFNETQSRNETVKFNMKQSAVSSYSEPEQSNGLYILDEELKVIGKIEGLAKDERVYSARFMGDIGYFVTFRQVDPLFSVDLSNPKDPKIIGELKITGFSEYLHFYKDNLLLGIGKEVDPDTNRTTGIKLSMFDISDPSNVKEIHKYVMEDSSDAAALYDHKAVLIDTSKNIFGFSMDTCEASENGEYKNLFRLFSYEEGKGFVKLLEQQNNIDWESYYGGALGIYNGDYLYVIRRGTDINSYHMADYKKAETLKLS